MSSDNRWTSNSWKARTSHLFAEEVRPWVARRLGDTLSSRWTASQSHRSKLVISVIPRRYCTLDEPVMCDYGTYRGRSICHWRHLVGNGRFCPKILKTEWWEETSPVLRLYTSVVEIIRVIINAGWGGQRTAIADSRSIAWWGFRGQFRSRKERYSAYLQRQSTAPRYLGDLMCQVTDTCSSF